MGRTGSADNPDVWAQDEQIIFASTFGLGLVVFLFFLYLKSRHHSNSIASKDNGEDSSGKVDTAGKGHGKGRPPPPPGPPPPHDMGDNAGKAKAKAKAGPTPEEIAEARRKDQERLNKKSKEADKTAKESDKLGYDADALAKARKAKETQKKCPLCHQGVPEAQFAQHWMGHENCILEDWLFLGSKDNVNVKTMLRREITHILNVANSLHKTDKDTTCMHIQGFLDDHEKEKQKHKGGGGWFGFGKSKELKLLDYTVRSFCWEDHEAWVDTHLKLDADSKFGLKAATAFIHEARRSHKKVMVHCSMGISRSAAVVIAYLMQHEKMSLRQAWDRVRERRGIARPNAGLIRLLGRFEVELHGGKPTLTPEDVDKWEKEHGKKFDVAGTFDAYPQSPRSPSKSPSKALRAPASPAKPLQTLRSGNFNGK